MKKNILIVCFMSLIISSCYNLERNCSDFKTGKFEFSQDISGIKQTTTFVRTNKYQIETYNGKTDTASVRWVSDCEFILEKLHPKSMQDKKAISMKILSTKDKTYTFEYSFVNDEKKQTGIVTKLD
ncbi:MAG: DNA topoisomerase IV [Flavobacterium sp.]|nr:DNA topoisomerase IV [Flavobacterium sp.]